MKKYDFVAIGGGNAGLTAVSRIAAAGFRTALIDRGPVGGLCSLNGCNPKKVLVRSSEVLEEVRHAAKFGIDVGEVRVDWSRVIDRKESFTSPVTPATEDSLRQQGTDLLHGTPRFVGRNELAVNGDHLEAASVLIATGSTPQRLDFEGAELVKTSNDILALRRVPADLVIIGAGVVAFEFAQVFARAGSRVTMLARGDEALAGNDQDMVAALVEFSRGGLGISIVFQASVRKVQSGGDRLRVEYEADGQMKQVAADFVLNAAGRVASIAELGLETAGVQTDKRGVVVNDFLRSPSHPQVFAAGDAHGRMQLSPVASYEGRVVARNFLEHDAERVNYDGIARCIYTIPPLASVGLTGAQARQKGLDVSVYTNDMTGWKVYGIAGEQAAKSKIIVENGTDHIVGAHIYAASAGDQIHTFALALRYKIPASELKAMVFAYPTFHSALPYTMG
jgi:glutathione reductase (NADPH)